MYSVHKKGFVLSLTQNWLWGVIMFYMCLLMFLET